ncbi:MAG: hypothetical protein QGG40_06770, partial [Myxococcota bacterium]|nr:hypothetical protein [Myxococcota bacterium]
MLTARSLFPALLTSMACSPTITQERYVLPKADLSASNIDFGEVDWGDSITRNLVLTNNGELPMGIGSIALGEDGMEDNFALVYYESEIACDDSDDTGSSAGAKEAGLDSGGGGETGGWDSGDETTSEDDDDDTLVLNPGCELSIRVKFSPVL